MACEKRPRMRPPVKREAIVNHFRGKILSGELRPGEALPTHEAVRLMFKTGSVTVQKAFDILAEQGFVDTVPGHHSMVSRKLPHKNRIAVVIPGSNDLAKNRFFLSLLHVVEQRQVPSSYEFVPYLVNILRGETGVDDSEKLLTDVFANALKGVILASNPTIEEARLTEIQAVCPLVLLSAQSELYFRTSYLTVDHFVSFFEEALQLAKRVGGRRVALFLNGSPIMDRHMAALLNLVSRNGLETRDEWIHGFAILNSRWTRNVARLLFSQAEASRPDTLIIMDDNLVESATFGLSEIKDLSPADLTVVAHANYPEIVPSYFPAHRIGFDVSGILLKGAEMIDRLGGRPAVAIHERIKAVHLPQNNLFRADASGSARSCSLQQNILMHMEGK